MFETEQNGYRVALVQLDFTSISVFPFEVEKENRKIKRSLFFYRIISAFQT